MANNKNVQRKSKIGGRRRYGLSPTPVRENSSRVGNGLWRIVISASRSGYERLKERKKIDSPVKRRHRRRVSSERATFGENTNNENLKISFKPSRKHGFLPGRVRKRRWHFYARVIAKEYYVTAVFVIRMCVCGHSVVIPPASPYEQSSRAPDVLTAAERMTRPACTRARAVKRRRQSIGLSYAFYTCTVRRRTEKRPIGDVKNLKPPKSIDASPFGLAYDRVIRLDRVIKYSKRSRVVDQ